jgi:hypothetical protein
MGPRVKTQAFKRVIGVGILCAMLSHGALGYVGADLPPLLEFADGTSVQTIDEWQARQTEIRGLMLDTFTGTFPKQTPRLLDAQTVGQIKRADGVIEQRMTLTFDTEHRISMEICRFQKDQQDVVLGWMGSGDR